jgi:hypothetical protein
MSKLGGAISVNPHIFSTYSIGTIALKKHSNKGWPWPPLILKTSTTGEGGANGKGRRKGRYFWASLRGERGIWDQGE